MLNRRDIIYTYDGTFYGLMSAVFECYYNHEYPFDIREDRNLQTELFCDYFHAKTDETKAERVIKSINTKISSESLYYIYCVYLSSVPDKEMRIFDFMAAGYKFGPSVTNRINLECVGNLINAAKTILGEAHLYRGFVRFKKLQNGIYYSEIEPKGRVLPLITEHFCRRFSSMPFIICDLSHNECLVYNGKAADIREISGAPDLQYAEDEQTFQDMWREFYRTIEIKERHNEKCRMNLMPKRYWRYMTEFN